MTRVRLLVYVDFIIIMWAPLALCDHLAVCNPKLQNSILEFSAGYRNWT